jgi:hypothetical protein
VPAAISTDRLTGVVSPSHHATGTGALTEGWPVGSYALLAGLALVSAGVAAAALQRRDIGT